MNVSDGEERKERRNKRGNPPLFILERRPPGDGVLRDLLLNYSTRNFIISFSLKYLSDRPREEFRRGLY